MDSLYRAFVLQLVLTGCTLDDGQQATTVKTEAPQNGGAAALVNLICTIESDSVVTVRSEVNGTVQSVEALLGNEVVRDTPLFVIADDQTKTELHLYEAQLQRARAELHEREAALIRAQVSLPTEHAQSIERVALLEGKLGRLESITAKGLGAQSLLDDAKLDLLDEKIRLQQLSARLTELDAVRQSVSALHKQVEAYESLVETASSRSSKSVIKAPFAGRLLAVDVKPGETITGAIDGSNGTRLGVFGSMDDPYFRCLVNELDVQQLAEGSIGTVTVGVNKVRTEAQLTHVSRVGEVKAEGEPPSYLVRAKPLTRLSDVVLGMAVQFSAKNNSLSDKISVPLDAVEFADTGATVLVQGPSGVQPRRVTVGAVTNESVVILDGLSKTETVVTQNPGRDAQ